MRYLTVALCALLLAVPASAKKPSHRAALAAADAFAVVGTPTYGGTITFSGTDSNWVSVVCAQNGRNVYGQYWNYDPTYDPGITPDQDTTIAWDGVFMLSQPLWSGGPADCTATLSTFDSSHVQTVIETLTFQASG